MNDGNVDLAHGAPGSDGLLVARPIIPEEMVTALPADTEVADVIFTVFDKFIETTD